MHPTNRDRKPLLGALVLLSLAVAGQAVRGQEPAPAPRVVPGGEVRPGSGVVSLGIGETRELGTSSKKRLRTVTFSRDGIVFYTPHPDDPSKAIITGQTTGRVRVTLVDADGKEDTFEFDVQLNVAEVKRLIAKSVPTANVDVLPVFNRTVILTGWVARAEDVEVILNIARVVIGGGATVINAMQVGGVQQVQLDVTVASVSRTEVRRRGFNFAITGTDASVASIFGALVNSSTAAIDQFPGTGTVPMVRTFTPGPSANMVFGITRSGTQMLLQALRDESLAKVLAEPKITALSGRPGQFLAGGQQAILSASGGLGGPGVDYRDVGAEVEYLPVVLGNGRIYLEVSARFRNRNDARGITTAFGFVPGFDVQMVRTALELEPGQTMAIGGLIQTVTAASAQKVPILGDLPYLGALFSLVSHSDEETELVILVTPHLVDGQDCRQMSKRLPGRETRSPDDYELFLESLLEAPRGQRQVFENGKYKAAYKNDPSYQRFPCADPLPKEPRPGKRGLRGGNAAADACPPAAPPAAGPVAYGNRPTPPAWAEAAPAAVTHGAGYRVVPAPVIPAPADEDPRR